MAERKAVADDVAAEIDAQNADKLAEVAAEVEQHRQDETIEGGRYFLADGKTLVNAEGQRIDKHGNVLKADA